MESLWALINLNQLIYLFPLLSIDLPSNSLILFRALNFIQGDNILIQYIYSYPF